MRASYIFCVALVATLLGSSVAAAIQSSDLTDAPLPRLVRVRGQKFVVSATNETIVMAGPNVVVKGPPYLPVVEGDTTCADLVDSTCMAAGNCTTCYTFNDADAAHLKAMGWNAIRLGVAWAGAQTTDTDSLDPEFERRLHSVLNLTDHHGIHVVMDNHADMVGTAGCGNGVPMWVQKLAAPELIGKPLSTDFPYSLIPELNIKNVAGYDTCGDNATLWALHAGNSQYNLLNPCCQAINSPNPQNIGFTAVNQKTMSYILSKGPGRDLFVRYWRLMAKAVASHPSAFAVESLNEPMTIWRQDMYDTWREIGQAVNQVIPDMSISIADLGENSLIPSWVTKLVGDAWFLDAKTEKWIIESDTVYYAWHWYGAPSDPHAAVANMQALSTKWNVPTFATEFMSCEVWRATTAANISHLYWHYSSYCNTNPAFRHDDQPSPTNKTFGACILGWGGGNSEYTCPP